MDLFEREVVRTDVVLRHWSSLIVIASFRLLKSFWLLLVGLDGEITRSVKTAPSVLYPLLLPFLIFIVKFVLQWVKPRLRSAQPGAARAIEDFDNEAVSFYLPKIFTNNKQLAACNLRQKAAFDRKLPYFWR